MLQVYFKCIKMKTFNSVLFSPREWSPYGTPTWSWCAAQRGSSPPHPAPCRLPPSHFPFECGGPDLALDAVKLHQWLRRLDLPLAWEVVSLSSAPSAGRFRPSLRFNYLRILYSYYRFYFLIARLISITIFLYFNNHFTFFSGYERKKEYLSDEQYLHGI